MLIIRDRAPLITNSLSYVSQALSRRSLTITFLSRSCSQGYTKFHCFHAPLASKQNNLEGLVFLRAERGKTMQIAAYVGIASVVTLVVIYLLAKKLLQGKKTKRATKPGTVVLHQFPPYAFRVVNGSPPCLKLETFLRMTQIPYENDYSIKFSKKEKMPWIEFQRARNRRF